jgi:hypothetical protein
VGNGHAVVAASACGQLGLHLHQARVACQHEVGGGLVGFGHVLRHLRHAPLRRDEEVAAVFVQRLPLNSANRLDLPAPLRPTRPTFSPGLMVALTRLSSTLALRRKVTLRSNHVIISVRRGKTVHRRFVQLCTAAQRG